MRISGKNAKARAAAKLGVAFRQGHTDPQTRLVRDDVDPLQAGIWSWDGEFEIKSGTKASTVRVIPETLAREGYDNGARLVRCIDGYEGQVWRDSALIASRWWPNTPTGRDWQQFLRAAKASAESSASEAPIPCDAPFRRDLPFVDLEPANLRLTLAPARVAGISACLLLLVASFEAAQYLTHKSVSATRSAQIEAALSENSAAIEARRRALTAAGGIEQLAAFGSAKPAALAYLAVASEIPADKARIANFRLYDQQVEARILMPEDAQINIPDLVSRLEKNNILANVYVERRNARTIGVTAEVVPIKAPNAESLELRD